MTRAVALLLVVAALTFVAAPGCKRSSETNDPKVDLKGQPPPIQPVQPAGGGPAAKQGPASSTH
jgi:hypothetical protein